MSRTITSLMFAAPPLRLPHRGLAAAGSGCGLLAAALSPGRGRAARPREAAAARGPAARAALPESAAVLAAAASSLLGYGLRLRHVGRGARRRREQELMDQLAVERRQTSRCRNKLDEMDMEAEVQIKELTRKVQAAKMREADLLQQIARAEYEVYASSKALKD